jgi:hypothetical protein
MSDEIKVGDVCEVVQWCCEGIRPREGLEVVVEEFTHDHCFCARCGYEQTGGCVLISRGGSARIGACPVHWLRKKPPKVDSSQWIRQEVVPLDQWREQLERWREQKPKPVYV